MSKHNQINKEIANLENLLKPDNRQYALFIEYHNLVKNPQKVLDKIYQFLDIPKYKHRFTKLDQLKVNGMEYDDTYVGQNLHTIHTKNIKLQRTNIKKLLPLEIIKAYSHLKWNYER